jgi:HEAT repeats
MAVHPSRRPAGPPKPPTASDKPFIFPPNAVARGPHTDFPGIGARLLLFIVMRKRERNLTAAVLFAAACLGIVAWTALRSDRTFVDGRPLRSWLRQLDASTPSWPFPMKLGQGGFNWSPAGAQAAAAVRKLGASSLPYLLQTLTNTGSSLRARARELLQSKLHCELIHSASEFWRGAVLGFAVLGAGAKPALPALAGALNLKSQDENVRRNVALVLASMGPEGQAALVRGLESTNSVVAGDCALTLKICRVSTPAVLKHLMRGAVRDRAKAPFFISLLCDLGPHSTLAVPFLTNEIRSPTPSVRMAAIAGLGRISGQGVQARTAIAALMEALQSTNIAQQAAAALSLGNFGPQARVAEPALLRVLLRTYSLHPTAFLQAAQDMSSNPATRMRWQFLERYGLAGGNTPREAVATIWSSLDQIDLRWRSVLSEMDAGWTNGLPPGWTMVPIPSFVRPGLKGLKPRPPGQSLDAWLARAAPTPSFVRPGREAFLAVGKGLKPQRLAPSLNQWLARVTNGPPEPCYGGRALSEWLRDAAPTASPQQTFQVLDAFRSRARQAVSAIGTNAIPWLLTWLDASNGHEALLSRRGFALLGKQALCAVPALGQLAQSDEPQERNRAYGAMMSINPDWQNLLPVLLPVLHSPDPNIRRQAAAFLAFSHPQEAERAGTSALVVRFGWPSSSFAARPPTRPISR